MNWWVVSFDAPWSELSWITGSDLDPTSFPASLTSPTPGVREGRETLGTRLISIIRKGTTLKLVCMDPWRSFIYQSVITSISLSACLPACLPAWLSVRLSVCLSLSQSVSQSVSLSVCLSIYLSPLYTPHLLVHVCLEAVNQVISSFPCLCLWTYFQLTMLLSGNINVLMFF